MTKPIFKSRPTSPSEGAAMTKDWLSQRPDMVGASKRKIAAAACPLRPQKNENYIVSKKSADHRDRHGHCQDQRVALQEVAL